MKLVFRNVPIAAQRQLGQNFLLDQNVTDKIVRSFAAEGQLSKTVFVEVGPGPGGLTRSLLKSGCPRVVAIEKDRRFEPILKQISAESQGRLEVIFEDITKLDQKHLSGQLGLGNGEKLCIAGNLPFNIASLLLSGWLEDCFKQRGLFRYGDTEMLLMFQSEVSERITAQHNSPKRARLSVMSQLIMTPTIVYTVPRTVFVPRPKVDAAVVRFQPLCTTEKLGVSFDFLDKFIETAFSNPRKMLKNNLSSMNIQWGSFSDIAPTSRPENLSNESWRALILKTFAESNRQSI